MNNLYRELLLDHWQHPQNYGVVDNADIDITDNNPLCGDEIRLTLKLSNNKITDIKFTAESCAIAKSSASLFSETVKGMSKKNVLAIGPKEVLNLLGTTLTPSRTKCALLVYQTINKGLKKKATDTDIKHV